MKPVNLNDITWLLSDSLKGRNRSKDQLVYLFRDIMVKRKFKTYNWMKNLDYYFKRDPVNRDPRKDRGNLSKHLLGDKFTWGLFKKAIDFLDPISATFTVTLEWPDGSEKDYHIVLDPKEDEDDYIADSETDEIKEAFSSDGKHAPTTLARLFRCIVIDRGLDKELWDQYLQEYVENPVTGIPTDQACTTKERNARDREFRSPRMSWTVFFRSLVFLKAQSGYITMVLKWKDNSLTHHRAALRLPRFEAADEN